MEQPEPDARDWTFVIDDGCAECGFSPDFDRSELPSRIRSNATAWQEVLGRATVRNRPASAVWSPLEYACHVRDVLVLYDERLGLMLQEDDPVYPNWDQDAAALAGGYTDSDPAVVSSELVSAGARVAGTFAAVHGDQWARPGRRSDAKSFTVERFGRYFLHDLEHHLYDVGPRPLPG